MIDTAAFLVNSIHAHMLQVHAISLPVVVVRDSYEFHGVSRRLNLVAGHNFAVVLGYGFTIAVCIGNIVPANLVAHLGVFLVILFHAHALAVHKEFHFVSIGIGDETHFRTLLTVPMVTHAVVACLHAVPHHVTLLVNDGDMHQRFLRFEETLHIVGLGLGLQGNVEYALHPSFGRPSLTFSEIVNHSPISHSDNLVQIHGKIVFAHG